MIITTWIMYIFARKGTGFSFPPKTSSDIEVVESEAVSVVQHWLKKTEEEASQNIKEKMSNNGPPTYGQNIHVTKDVTKHQLSKSDLLANQSQDVLEERTRIQFIRWSHTRIFQVPSEVRDEVMRDRIEQVRRSCVWQKGSRIPPEKTLGGGVSHVLVPWLWFSEFVFRFLLLL
ncbi:spermatogenesis-associated protein 19, mitochondrial [Saccopteryx leptura]|uniref:spermatogenesis-associated protein 19, mitochondrial n=1 Tax=Saccopteryx leptura TaxID=249018 RepID=UPI00339C1625